MARTSLTFDRAKQPALPLWLPILAALLIVARIVSTKYAVKADVDLVRWLPSPRQATIAAVRLNRPILYEFSAEWCGPCHALERDVFMDASLAALINNRYIPVKVIDRQREDGRNDPIVQQLMDRYGVNAFPTVIIASADGKVLDRVVGYGGPEKFTAFLDRVR
jgi:thiol-disulfide isomerase/thioredoxin